MEGFSIREYVSKMRIVNLDKCWPFDDTAGEETVKSSLPPIAIQKFKWWIDELEYMHSDCGKNVTRSETKTKNLVLEKAGTSLAKEAQTVLDPDIDNEEEGTDVIKVKSLRGKGKAPKKRSIVEIFAVAPPIERGNLSEELEEKDSVQEEDRLKKKRKKKTKNSNGGTILCKAKRVIKKKKANKGACEMDLSIVHKEDYMKTKLQHGTDKSVANLSPSSVNDQLENGGSDCVSTLNRKWRQKHLHGALRLDEDDNQHSELFVHGASKNNPYTITQQQSLRTILRKGVGVNQWIERKANRHVTFSDNADTLGRRPFQTIQRCDLQEVCNLGTVNGKPAGAAVETSAYRDASRQMEDEFGAAAVSVKDLNKCLIKPSIVMKQNSEEKLFSRPVASERHALHCMDQCLYDNVGIGDTPRNKICPCHPGFFIMPLQGSYSFPTIKLMQDSSNCMHNGFVGLPLNSQGELTVLNSSSKMGFNQTMASTACPTQSMRLSSASNAARKCSGKQAECQNLGHSTSTLDMLNLFPANGYVKANAVIVPSKVGDISVSRGDQKRNHYLDFLTVNSYPSADSLNKICIDDNQVGKSHGKQKISSTMRLMGQDFTIRGKGFDGLENGGHSRKNKLHSGNNSTCNKTALGQKEPFVRKLRKTILHPTEFTANQVPHSMHKLSQFDCQSVRMYCHDMFAKEVNSIPKSHSSCSPRTFSEVFNRSLPLPESKFSSHTLRTPAGAHHEACPDARRCPTTIHLIRNKMSHLPHSTMSAIRFPSVPASLEEQATFCRNQRSSPNWYSMCCDFSEDGKQSVDNPSFHHVGNNYPMTGVSCLFSPFSSGFPMQSSMVPTSPSPHIRAHNTVVPFHQRVSLDTFPVSMMVKRQRKRKRIKEQNHGRTNTVKTRI